MADSIAVTHSGIANTANPLQTLKRLALVFDRIGLVDISSGYFRLEPLRDKIEWLIEKNIIFEPDSGQDFNYALQNKQTEELGKSFFKELSSAFEPVVEYHSGKKIHLSQYNKIWNNYFDTNFDFFTRISSINLRKNNQATVYPLITKLTFAIEDLPADKVDVIRIVINSLPAPDDVTSWEQIIEYRNDEDTKGKLLGLKNWMSDVARAKLSPVEVEEKLEWLIYDYERHLKLHRLKTNTGTLEAFIVTTAELAEDLVKFKWGKFAKTLFSLKQRQIQLLEGEMNLPGNEIAYIIKTKQKFSS